MAYHTVDTRMLSGQWEGALIMVERRRVPAVCGMAIVAGCCEAALNVVWIACPFVVTLVTGIAGSRCASV